MEEKLENNCCLSQLGSDSGIILVNNDVLVEKIELQDRQLKCKTGEIDELKNEVGNLQDMVLKYKKQLEDVQKSKEQPMTTWTRKLLEENKMLRERVELVTTAREEFASECMLLEECLEEQSKELEMFKERFHQSETVQKKIPLQETEQEKSTLANGLIVEKEELIKNMQLLSIENEELSNEYAFLVEDIKAKDRDVMILEDRVNELEEQLQQSVVVNEEEVLVKEESAPNLCDEKYENMHAERKASANILMKEEDAVAPTQMGEEEELKIRNENPELVGKILPERVASIQDCMEYIEELKFMRDLFMKVSSYLELDVTFKEDEIFIKKTEILKAIENKVVELVNENRDIKKAKMELKGLTEFLESERHFTVEELKELKSKNARIEEKIQNHIQENSALQDQLNFWSDCCGKLYVIAKTESKDLGRVNSEYAEIGKKGKAELSKKNKLRKSHRYAKNQLKRYKARLFSASRCVNALGGKNLELEIKIKELEEELVIIKEEQDVFDAAYKEEVAESVLFCKEMEEYREQESRIKNMEAVLCRKSMELDMIMSANEVAFRELEEARKLQQGFERRLKQVSIEKEEIQGRMIEEISQHAYCKTKLNEIEAEKQKVEVKLEDELKTIFDEAEILKEEKGNIRQELEGEMMIRHVYEKRMREITLEKKEMKESLENELKKNAESETIILRLQEMVQERAKLKRSRFRRFFRRGSG